MLLGQPSNPCEHGKMDAKSVMIMTMMMMVACQDIEDIQASIPAGLANQPLTDQPGS
jgi:hypothetical protein